MKKRVLLVVNFILALVIAIILSFLIIGPYTCAYGCLNEDCTEMFAADACTPTDPSLRIIFVVIVTAVIFVILTLAEFIFKKIKKK